MAMTASGPAVAPGRSAPGRVLRARWLGSVDYREAWDLQRALFAGTDDHLLLLEHPPVYTIGRSGSIDHLLVDPAELAAEVVRVNRGGDITFHGPGQIVGYPVLSVPGQRGGGLADTGAYVERVERALIEVLARFGLDGGRLAGFPGVWLGLDGPSPRKIGAIGVRLSRGRSMHGFSLNVDVDLAGFASIVPCGIADKAVTSFRQEGVDASIEEVADALVEAVGAQLCPGRPIERADVVHRSRTVDLAPFSRGLGPGEPVRPRSSDPVPDPSHADPPPVAPPPVAPPALAPPALAPAPDSTRPDPGASSGVPVRLLGRLERAGVTGGLDIGTRKPPWLRVHLRTDPTYRELRRTARSLDLTTVCEEAGCPNIYECWNEGTATFMLLGERCTRACGFCLVDTRHPGPVDEDEPARVAEAVERLGLSFAVLTMVARDDLPDGGAGLVAATVAAIRGRSPSTGIEVLISDLKGSAEDLATVCGAGPDIVNHNVETVPRLQRAVRPSAGYARSLTLLARARAMGRTTKSGLIVGMGETFEEVVATLADLAAIGVDIVTIGQYLRPTSHHLPISRWWTPDEFDELARIGTAELGLGHVEASPLTRSSHHAGSIARSVDGDRPEGRPT
jgi:lipoic acid synthetase